MDADRLSSNAVFPQIMSFLDWKSVNCCKLANRSINDCIHREWRTIQRRKANIEIASISKGGLYLYGWEDASAVDLVDVSIRFLHIPGPCSKINPYTRSGSDLNVEISQNRLVIYGDRAEAFRCLLQQCQDSYGMQAEWVVTFDKTHAFSAECTIDDHLITIRQVLTIVLSAISINNVVISETPEEDQPDDDSNQYGQLSLDQLRVIKDCFRANKQKSNPLSTELSILDEEHLQLYRILGSDCDKLGFFESRRNDWLDCSIGQMDLHLRNAEVLLCPEQFTSLLPLETLLQVLHEWSSAKRRIKRLTLKNLEYSWRWTFENEDWHKILPRSIVQQKYNKTDCTLEGVLQRPADGRYLSFKFERNIYVFEEISNVSFA